MTGLFVVVDCLLYADGDDGQVLMAEEGMFAPETDLPLFRALFDDGWIYDWNVCDWFSVKALDQVRSMTWLVSLFAGGPGTSPPPPFLNGITRTASTRTARQVIRMGPVHAAAVASWAHDSEAPMWRRRAGCVAFVYTAKDGDANFDGAVP